MTTYGDHDSALELGLSLPICTRTIDGSVRCRGWRRPWTSLVVVTTFSNDPPSRCQLWSNDLPRSLSHNGPSSGLTLGPSLELLLGHSYIMEVTDAFLPMIHTSARDIVEIGCDIVEISYMLIVMSGEVSEVFVVVLKVQTQAQTTLTRSDAHAHTTFTRSRIQDGGGKAHL